MDIVRGESGGWIVTHGGKTLWSGYETEEAARGAADQGIARMFRMRSERMLRFLDMATDPGHPGVPEFIISQEARLIRAALQEVEARWGDPDDPRSSPSPKIQPEMGVGR